MKYDYTVSELRDVAEFVDEINKASAFNGVAIDGLSDQFLVVGGKETPFHLRLDDDGTHYVSVVVPL